MHSLNSANGFKEISAHTAFRREKFHMAGRGLFVAVYPCKYCFFVCSKHRLAFSNYFLMADSNKILAVLTAISLFCLFKCINIGQTRWVNQIATATFGIFLIHDHPNF